jgi:rhodanese-related sulfurtransferase/rubrerythrin
MLLNSFFKPVKSISTEAVRTLIKEKGADEYCLLDVRQPGEYEQGHLPGARLIPLGELKDNLQRIQPDVMTVVYCRSGNRSRSGVGILNGAGFENVYNMDGGMLAYNGMVASGPPEAGVFCFPEHMRAGELIAMAWYVEDGSRNFLETIRELYPEPEIREVLDRLIHHKEAHKETLAGLYGGIDGKSPGEDFPGGVLKRPPRDVMAGCVGVAEALTWASGRPLVDILDLMIALEANTYDLFLKLSRQMASKEATSVFARLAEEQGGHLGQLGGVFEKNLF